MTFKRIIKMFCNSCSCGNKKLTGSKSTEYSGRRKYTLYLIRCDKCRNNTSAYGMKQAYINWNEKNPGLSIIKKEGFIEIKKIKGVKDEKRI